MNVITPPHPTPPVADHERAVQCLCLQDSKKNDEVAVPVCAQEHERYYPTPPHPTPLETWMRDDQGAQVSDILLVGAQVRGWPKGPHVPAPCPQVLP